MTTKWNMYFELDNGSGMQTVPNKTNPLEYETLSELLFNLDIKSLEGLEAGIIGRLLTGLRIEKVTP